MVLAEPCVLDVFSLLFKHSLKARIIDSPAISNCLLLIKLLYLEPKMSVSGYLRERHTEWIMSVGFSFRFGIYAYNTSDSEEVS